MRNLAVVVAVALVALAFVWLWRGDESAPATPPQPHATETAARGAAEPTGTSAAPQPEATGAIERDALPEATSASGDAPPPGPLAEVRGRCVDAAGQPRRGCTVAIVGSAKRESMDDWLRDQPAPLWRDLETTTGADGRFVLAFWPPPPMSFALHIAAPGSGSLRGGLRIAPGDHVDVGDVVLPLGVQVTGQVVDEQARPVADIEVQIGMRTTGNFGFAAPTALAPPVKFFPLLEPARSDARGMFQLPAPVAPGGYTLHLVHGAAYRDPRSIELLAERPREHVVLTCSLPADAPAIRGRVVDDAGLAVPGAWILLGESGFSGTRAVAGTDGAFAVRREHDDPDEVVLRAEREGAAPSTATAKLAWGATDVTLVLQRGGELVVRVGDADGRAIEHYAVRVVAPAGFRAAQGSVRARGPFANGIATIADLSAGECMLGIEFPTASERCTHVQPFVFDGTRMRIDVVAERAAHRTLRVVTAAGEPVAGTQVELLDYPPDEVDADTDALPLSRLLERRGRGGGLLVATGTTAADGAFALEGSPSRPLVLRVLGPGHIAIHDARVKLAERGDLVVTVQRGARLVAKIVPPGAVDELRRRGGVAPGAAFADGRAPSLQLFRAGPDDSEQTMPVERGKGPPMGDDGRFELDAIPAGTWRIGIAHWHIAGSRSYARLDRLDLGEVTLADGETVEQELDLAFALPGTLAGAVTRNGQVLADTDVMLAWRGNDALGNPMSGRDSTHTDAAGRFECTGPPGDYELQLQLDPQRAPQLRASATTRANVRRGETTRHTFDVALGELHLALRTAAGAPAADVQLALADPDGTLHELPRTDGDGRVRIPWSLGTTTIRVLPASLQSDAAQDAWTERARAAQQSDSLAAQWRAIGSATLRTAEPTELELRLPADW